MAHRIVDVLEPVEVDVDERNLRLRSLGARDLALQAILEELPVRQAGQVVVIRMLEQRGAALFATERNSKSSGERSCVTRAAATRLRIGEQKNTTKRAIDLDRQPI